jgi:hypothetical protein
MKVLYIITFLHSMLCRHLFDLTTNEITETNNVFETTEIEFFETTKTNLFETTVFETTEIESFETKNTEQRENKNGLKEVLKQRADLTYHLYTDIFPLTSVACSDGINGIITRWGYSDLSNMFPYVTAASFATWNSVKCGECIKITNGDKSIYVTVIDQCQVLSNKDHFDLSKEAFAELLGKDGVFRGSSNGNWEVVSNSNCKGNLG